LALYYRISRYNALRTFWYTWRFVGLLTEVGQCVAFALLAMLSVVAALFFTAARPIWKFLTYRQPELNADWLNGFDFSRYTVLTNLFHPRDFEFLKSQPGYAPELSARLKSDRLKIAESYLSQLERDVRRLLNFANYAAAHSPADHDELSAFLLKQEVRFTLTLLVLRMEITLMKLGLWRHISFDGLIESLRPLLLQSRVLALPN
jgi:hypothetical protein